MSLLNDKRGFIDIELNWPVFIGLAVVGVVAMALMLKVWSGMDYNVSVVTKIIIYLLPLPISFFFTKRWFE